MKKRLKPVNKVYGISFTLYKNNIRSNTFMITCLKDENLTSLTTIKIWAPEKFVVITLKFKQSGFTVE